LQLIMRRCAELSRQDFRWRHPSSKELGRQRFASGRRELLLNLNCLFNLSRRLRRWKCTDCGKLIGLIQVLPKVLNCFGESFDARGVLPDAPRTKISKSRPGLCAWHASVLRSRPISWTFVSRRHDDRDGATLDEKQDRRNFAGLTVDVGLDLVDMWTLWTCFGDGEGCPHTDRFSYLISFHRDN